MTDTWKPATTVLRAQQVTSALAAQNRPQICRSSSELLTVVHSVLTANPSLLHGSAVTRGILTWLAAHRSSARFVGA